MGVVARIRSLGAWFALSNVEPALAVTQLMTLRRQLPLLYLLLFINMTAVAYTHYGLAPTLLTVSLPALFCAICLIRGAHWLRQRSGTEAPAEAVRRLRLVVVLATVFAATFVAWSMALDGYGGPYERGHVAFFVAITVIGCIFCLMHLPQAATIVTGVVLTTYVVRYGRADHPVFTAIALNVGLVATVMCHVMAVHFRAFVDLERSKAALAAEQAQTRALGAENARLANTDSLTGLPNRRAFFARLGDLAEDAGGRAGTFALGVVDLDGFKPINDSFGHATGDRVLVELARRLEAFAGEGVTVARLGGDEFGVLQAGPADAAAAEAFGRAICASLSAPLIFDGLHLACGASCGIALHCGGRGDVTALFDRADYALYDAKASRRGDVVLFGEAHESRQRGERAVEATLLAADLEAEMEVHFQPIVELATGRDVAMEALARWTSPDLGPMPPDRFIEIAERTGLIRTLTPVLLRKALAHAASWPAELTLSFNLSAHDIVSPETVARVIALIQRSGVDPARITLEITETAVMRDFDLARRHIVALRAIGMRIALDDFGAGYSSLGCVHRLPLDRIKVDRAFMRDGSDDADGRKVVRTILDLCTTLHLECVVEGVETAEQSALVTELGGRYAQGYHFARPLSGEAVARRIGGGSRAEAA